MARAAGAPVKVAILEGGVAGLAAAFELSDPRHGGRFRVTLHQLGWRLGGKCASGRGMGVALRTKEHGPHIFFGFYDNAFAILREAYGALASDPSRVFKTIEDALVAHYDLDTMEQQSDGSWLPWSIPLPRLPGQPGDPLRDRKPLPTAPSPIRSEGGWVRASTCRCQLLPRCRGRNLRVRC